MTDQIEPSPRETVNLSPREKSALQLYENTVENNVLLSPRTSAEFLQLFLQGYSTEEIAKLNPGFKLGIIVKTRLEHEWDRHKREYIENLMLQTRESVQKTQLEAIRFALDGMAVHQRKLGENFKKYLQTGDESVLGKEQINIKSYREYVALMLQLTGQDKKQQMTGEVTHRVEDNTKTIDVGAIDGAALLMAMEQKK